MSDLSTLTDKPIDVTTSCDEDEESLASQVDGVKDEFPSLKVKGFLLCPPLDDQQLKEVRGLITQHDPDIVVLAVKEGPDSDPVLTSFTRLNWSILEPPITEPPLPVSPPRLVGEEIAISDMPLRRPKNKWTSDELELLHELADGREKTGPEAKRLAFLKAHRFPRHPERSVEYRLQVYFGLRDELTHRMK